MYSALFCRLSQFLGDWMCSMSNVHLERALRYAKGLALILFALLIVRRGEQYMKMRTDGCIALIMCFAMGICLVLTAVSIGLGAND